MTLTPLLYGFHPTRHRPDRLKFIQLWDRNHFFTQPQNKLASLHLKLDVFRKTTTAKKRNPFHQQPTIFSLTFQARLHDVPQASHVHFLRFRFRSEDIIHRSLHGGSENGNMDNVFTAEAKTGTFLTPLREHVSQRKDR